MLTIKNLSLDVKSKKILSQINLNLENNKVYGIVGPNGVGKTTLFKLILGITNYQGSITINHQPIKDSSVGKLIEYPSFYKNMTVKQSLELFANYIGVSRKDALSSLKDVGLQSAINTSFKNLSLGMKQRLGIARALMGNNSVLLLDEPQNGLDPLGIKSIRNLLNEKSIRKNRIIMLASHNLNEISKIVDRLIFVNHGQIICQIQNQRDSVYYVFQLSSHMQQPQITKPWVSSKIQGTNFLITTLSPKNISQEDAANELGYVGKIDNLESLFTFVVTKEVPQNVKAD